MGRCPNPLQGWLFHPRRILKNSVSGVLSWCNEDTLRGAFGLVNVMFFTPSANFSGEARWRSLNRSAAPIWRCRSCCLDIWRAWAKEEGATKRPQSTATRREAVTITGGIKTGKICECSDILVLYVAGIWQQGCFWVKKAARFVPWLSEGCWMMESHNI